MNLNVSLTQIDIETPDGVCDAHLATPAGEENFPAVLYLMDAFGVRPVIDEWVKRIAAKGYVVLAPNLFYRSAKAPIIEDVALATSGENRAATFQSVMPMMQILTPENIAKDARAYIDFLYTKAKPGPVATSGYCLGARVALRAAAAYPDEICVVAGFHGGNMATDQPDSPHLGVDKLKAEVYFGYADHDAGANEEQRERMDQALTAAGLVHLSEVYADAPHGYTMSDTEAYREDAAERHFNKLIEVLDRNLKA